MSLDVIAWTLSVALVASAQPSSPDCSPAARSALERTAAAAARGDYAGAAENARLGYDAVETCGGLRVAAWAWNGWLAAVAAADRGGAPDALAPVTRAIEAVSALGPRRSEAAYAATLLRAAAAAAQDEREEMQVWLEEARSVSATLALLGPAPTVPLEIDLAEGELWHGVDDFEFAEAAFTRALGVHESAAAWRGLARARDRRGNRSGACEAYRRVAAALSAETTPGPLAAEARGYLLLCTP